MSELDEFIGTDVGFKSDFIQTATGDLDVITGLDNLKESIYRRIITTQGSVIHRPEYGCSIKKWIGSLNSIDNQRSLAIKVKEQLEQDPRIELVTGVSFKIDDNNPDRVELKCRIVVVGYGETTMNFVPFGDV